MSSSRKAAALALLVALTLPSCATKYNTADESTTTAPASTTTTIPRGTLSELFQEILSIGRDLGNDVASGKSTDAREKLADIKATWQAIQPMIADQGADLNADLQRLINLYITSVERKRPADADKATRFLTLAIEPLVGAAG